MASVKRYSCSRRRGSSDAGWSHSQGNDHCGLLSCDTGLQGQPPCGGWLSWPNLGKGPFRTWNVWERKLAESTTFGDYFPSTAVGLLHTYDSSVAHIHAQLYNYFKLFFGVKLAVLPWRHYGNYSTRGQRETNGSRGGTREEKYVIVGPTRTRSLRTRGVQ